MASYQDLDIRMKVLEDKVAFTMKIAKAQVAVGNPLSLDAPQVIAISFDDLYRQVKLSGGELVEQAAASEPDVIPGEILDA